MHAFIDRAIEILLPCLFLLAFVTIIWKAWRGRNNPKYKTRRTASNYAENAHKDLMAHTSGTPMSNGCISPIYLSNNQNRDHF